MVSASATVAGRGHRRHTRGTSKASRRSSQRGTSKATKSSRQATSAHRLQQRSSKAANTGTADREVGDSGVQQLTVRQLRIQEGLLPEGCEYRSKGLVRVGQDVDNTQATTQLVDSVSWKAKIWQYGVKRSEKRLGKLRAGGFSLVAGNPGELLAELLAKILEQLSNQAELASCSRTSRSKGHGASPRLKGRSAA